MEHEHWWRLAFFAGALLLFGIAEHLFPRRRTPPQRMIRWVGNLGLVAGSLLLLRILFPVLPVGLALLATERGWGLLNNVPLPYPGQFIAGLLLLDLVIYFQHRALHYWIPLWRIHRVHHADTVFDLTTGVRFHPLEYILSMGIKLLVVLVLGPPALAVIVFEIMLNGVSMFNHSNIRLPLAADARLRRLVVTPDMHRVHHSTNMKEANRNFGFNFPWWDRLFRTYQDQPAQGHEHMPIGLNIFRDANFQKLRKLLLMPFV
ncbi:sterol desaturase family protein [Desulfonatronum lacustre]|uniref:sterol desaturase family protein n=1 Tax=Desulfonatronum lacustre TaxID=66849 RepID=UPI00048EC521|nr:sterol desaturase family protein [Desulfonatronum lacustre]